MPDGQDVGILAKRIEHCGKQPGREYRGSQIADAFGIDGVVRRAVCRRAAGGDGQFARQPFAHLGALLARNLGELCFVIGGERLNEAAMRIAFDRPSGTAQGQRAAAQFDGRAAQP